jgi:hypothetical protein
MLNQPLMEKLLAMRLQGMVEGLKAQEQDKPVSVRYLSCGTNFTEEDFWPGIHEVDIRPSATGCDERQFSS